MCSVQSEGHIGKTCDHPHLQKFDERLYFAANHDQDVEIYQTTCPKKMTEKLWEVIAKRKAGTTFSTALGLAEPKAAGLICGF